MHAKTLTTHQRRAIPLLLCAALILILAPQLQPKGIPTASANDAERDRCFAKKVLFIGGSRPLPAQDEILRFYLLALGQQVIVRSGDEVSSTDAKGKALIIISESVESSDIKKKFRESDLPILTWEGWLQDDLGMTAAGTMTTADTVETGAVEDKDEGAYGETLGQKSILIINPNHPLAAGYSGEVTTVTNRLNKFHWGAPNANAIRVAQEVTEAEHIMLYAYEKGVPMVGLTAPARRVFLHNATGSSLTTAGLSLFLNAAYWAMGCLDEESTVTPTTPPTTTNTATPTATSTSTATASATPTPIAQSTAPTLPKTATPTGTPSAIPTVTPTAPPTGTPSPTVTTTPTGNATATPTEIAPTATATATPSLDGIKVEKSDLLFNDADENGQVSRGDTLLYIIRVENSNNSALQDILLEDQLDINTTLVTGSVQSSQGTIDQGNQSGDEHLLVRIDTLAAQSSLQISFQAQIKPTSNVALLINQATVRFIDEGALPSGQQQRLSNDPDTPAPDDATLTQLGGGTIRSIFLPFIAHQQ